MIEYPDLRADDDDDENGEPEPDAPKKENGKEKEQPPAFTTIQQNLYKSRLVLLFGEINMKVAQAISAQLLALDYESSDPIKLVINSPGGHVEAGDTIHDMLRFVKAPIKVLGTGWVASAGVHIFLGAKPENRYCLPNTRFMIHQPLGGLGGKAVDIAIEAREIIKMRERLNRIISKETGQPYERVAKDTDRNYWMSSEEARDYGVVTHIINGVDEYK